MQIKQTLMSWTEAANNNQLQPFLRNKLAQVVVLVLRVRPVLLNAGANVLSGNAGALSFPVQVLPAACVSSPSPTTTTAGL